MSLANAVGAGATIELGGETLKITPRLVRYFGEMENEIRKDRGNPFDLIRQAAEALKDSDPEILERIIGESFMAAKRWKDVSMGEIWEWMVNSWKGRRYAIWLTIRDNDPKWTFEHFTQVFCDEFEDRYRTEGAKAAQDWMSGIESTIEQIGGEDEVGNSTGSQESTATETEEVLTGQ